MSPKYISKPYNYDKEEFLPYESFIDKHWNNATIDGGVYTGYDDTGFRLKVKRR